MKNIIKHRFMGVRVAPHWIALLVALFFTTEYARLALTTAAPRREAVIFVCWFVLLITMILNVAIARKRHDTE